VDAYEPDPGVAKPHVVVGMTTPANWPDEVLARGTAVSEYA
jgi:hypothetical protein